MKGNGLDVVLTVWVVEMFTTDGINLSARSANEAGTDFEFDWTEKLNANINVKINSFNFFILTFYKINNYKSYNCKN